MKILKIFGAVVAIHGVAFLLIFANPGCSSTQKPMAAAPAESMGPAPVITVPGGSSGTTVSTPTVAVPDAAPPTDATAASMAPATSRYSPTRPGTAAASAVLLQPATEFSPGTSYTVVNGDNLTLVAKKNHTTVKELAALNKLSPSTKLKLGQKLLVPTGELKLPASSMSHPETAAATPGVESAAKSTGGAMTYVVKPGESLSSIAHKFGLKSGQIAVANNITNPALIKAGMTLTIPMTDGWQAPKSSKPDSSTPSMDQRPPVMGPGAQPAVDQGAPPAPASEVPVIKVEDSPPASSPMPKNP
jgi:LysM repeat protein